MLMCIGVRGGWGEGWGGVKKTSALHSECERMISNRPHGQFIRPTNMQEKKSDSEDEEMLQCPAVRVGNALDSRGRFITAKQLLNTEPPPSPLSLNTELHMQVSSIIYEPRGNPAM